MLKKVLRRLVCLPEEDNKRDERTYNGRSIMHHFFQNSTTHGVGKIYGSKTVTARLFWFVFFLAILAVVLTQISQLVIRLFQYEITTSMDSETSGQGLQFPSVTFCNSDPNVLHQKHTHMLEHNISEADRDFFAEGAHNLSELFQQPESFFEPNRCIFAQRNCSYQKNFKMLTTATDGNCFTFNPFGELHQIQPGVAHGLTVVLNIEQENYDPEWHNADTNGASVAITFHANNTEPELSNEAYLAGPGQLTRLGIHKKVSLRQKYPYKDNCSDGTDESPHMCLTNCLVDQMMEKCNAVDVRTALDMKGHTGTLLPIAKNESSEKCVQDFMHHFLEAEVGCHCPVSCQEVMFQVSATQARWPTNAAMQRWLRHVRLHRGKENATEKYIRENYVAIQIYYQDFVVATTKHKPSYDFNMFLSDLGGQLGLWIGASIYSIFELVSFIIELIMYKVLVRKMRKEKERREKAEREALLDLYSKMPCTPREKRDQTLPGSLPQENQFLKIGGESNLTD